MKRILTTIFFFSLMMFSGHLTAQIVDIESTTQGVAPPRVPDASALDCTASEVGSIVYQTNDPEGLYTCDGSGWNLVGGGGGVTTAYKEITSTQTLAANTSDVSLGFDVAAPETGLYLILVNIQGIRTDGFIGPLTFKLTVNDVEQTAATRTVTYSTGYNHPIPMMHRMSLTAAQVVDVTVTNPSATLTGDVSNRNIVLMKL